MRSRLTVERLEAREVPSGARPEFVSDNPHDWPMFGHDPAGTRHNPAEHRLKPGNVDDLQEVWRFPTDGAIAGTPAVVGDTVYAADSAGSVYAVNADGTLKWKTTLEVNAIVGLKIAASVLVTNRTVVVGDNAGFIHGLDVDTGAERWTINPNPHPFAAIFGHGTMVGNYVAYGTSSFELPVPALDPTYTNFTFRGSVVLIDPADGRIVWQTYTITDAEHALGASGATVWSAPAFDPDTHTIFVGTSNNYSSPTTGTSDALMALDARTGAIKWVSQKTGGDNWNFSYLPEDPADPPDFDFGDAPQVYKRNGRTVVAAGQKSGFFHVVDAATGAEVGPPRQFLAGDHLGGFHIDSGYAKGLNFAPGNKWIDPFSGGQPEAGYLFAIKKDGSRAKWSAEFDAPVIGGVAIANRVVYVQSIDGTFYGLDARSGDELVRLDTGGQSGGPAVSRGRVYLGTGDVLTTAIQNPFFVPGPGSIVSLGLPVGDGPGQGVGRARHPDGPRVSVNDVTRRERDGGVTDFVFTVRLSAPATAPVSVTYVTAEGTARGGTDYEATAGTLTFAPGETRKTVVVWVIGDRIEKGKAKFYLNLGGAEGASFADARGVGTIRDDGWDWWLS